VISALSWRPKASGDGFKGKASMNLIYDCWSSAGGEMYIPDAEKLNLSSNA